MPIYTKKGDKGETGLPGGRRLSKTETIFDCLGGLDQTNALIGLAVSFILRGNTTGGSPRMSPSARSSEVRAVAEGDVAREEEDTTGGSPRSFIDPQREKKLLVFLTQLQSDLLSIGAAIAAKRPLESAILSKLDGRTAELERQIDRWDSQLPELKNFILPGGCREAAIIHLARVNVRQTERAFHRLDDTIRQTPIATYLNRLSDYFFQCARYLNHRTNTPDVIWTISDR